ncbi:MAG TPA: DNRLRE domain-containing protein, partial [Vicinamibacterales bacterium]
MNTAAFIRRAASRLSAALLLATAVAAPVAAQDVTLTDSMATTVRGGSYAATNYASAQVLETRASSDASYVRRVLLKFDTQNTIPQNTSIASAKLTLTVAGGNAESRTLTAYRVSTSYDEPQATWNARYTGTAWSKLGGDIAEARGTATVTAAVGSDVTFDVTALVQDTVNGKYGSRYTRIEIVDGGASSKDSYKQFYSDEAADAGVRPTLTITYGASTAPTPLPAPPPPPATTSTQLRVLHWNTHHGVGTDGKYDINRLATWMAKMNPDVITINEAEKYTGWGNEDQPARYKALLEQKTGKTWYVHFTQ